MRPVLQFPVGSSSLPRGGWLTPPPVLVLCPTALTSPGAHRRPQFWLGPRKRFSPKSPSEGEPLPEQGAVHRGGGSARPALPPAPQAEAEAGPSVVRELPRGQVPAPPAPLRSGQSRLREETPASHSPREAGAGAQRGSSEGPAASPDALVLTTHRPTRGFPDLLRHRRVWRDASLPQVSQFSILKDFPITRNPRTQSRPHLPDHHSKPSSCPERTPPLGVGT